MAAQHLWEELEIIERDYFTLRIHFTADGKSLNTRVGVAGLANRT
jgi:hypothetical protein